MSEDVTRGVNLSIRLSFESGVIAVATKMKNGNEEMCKYLPSERISIRIRNMKHGCNDINDDDFNDESLYSNFFIDGVSNKRLE